MSPRWTFIFPLVVFGLLIGLCRLHTFHQPLEWDVATHVLVAREWLEGARLYVDVWDIKPPGVFVMHALFQSVLGDSLLMVYLLGMVLSVLTMLAIYVAASVQGRAAGLVASGCFAVVCSDLYLEGNRPNAEAFINLCLAGGLAALLRSRNHRGMLIGIGLLALASFFKQPGLLPGAAVVVGRGRWREMAWFLAATLLLWGGIFGYFAFTGRAALAWETFVLSPRAYPGTLNDILRTSARLFASPALVGLLPCAILTAMAILMDRERRWLLLSMVLAALIVIALPARLFGHYYQYLLVPLTLGTGWGIASLQQTISGRGVKLVSATLLAGLALLQAPFYRLPVSEWTQRQYGGGYVILQDSIEPLRALLKPGETLLVWSDDPWVYYQLGRRLPTAMVFRCHVVDFPVGVRLAERVLRQLQDRPPDLLFLRDGWQGPENSPVWRWLMEHYRALPYDAANHPMAARYVRLGSDLDRRTAR